jgi:hypothetical protein
MGGGYVTARSVTLTAHGCVAADPHRHDHHNCPKLIGGLERDGEWAAAARLRAAARETAELMRAGRL